ncbi:hypothetical protein RX717_12275 [Intestinibacillus sp. NTUH-41-i26]|uniref:hypothetical protein n=1 Tax=Butyricicoccaceae TaxID=3085642 RepID=UPI000D1E319D|nr:MULTISPECIES: hypothetical protein [Butyricicoccaceae]MBS6881861.1 hypothetical protein [Clostridiaceae bacterium]WOC74752.1 hypothetical protein RX717_12275 [Intestinibacillus sp. NTUH-41-i26]
MGKRKGLIIGAIAVLLLAVACKVADAYLSYPIQPDMANLTEHISKFYNRGRKTEVSPYIALYDSVNIGDKTYCLMEIGEDLDFGSVALEKSVFGRYRIARMSYGGGHFRDGIIESGGKKYFLFAGRDITARICKATALIGGERYELYTPEQKDHFLLCTEISDQAQEKHVDRSEITFYDKNNRDITDQYNLSGGGI